MKKIILLLLLISAVVMGEERATLLYFNDAHVIYPVVDRHGERGGVARLKTIVDEVRKENDEALLLFGGDLAGGLLFGTVYKGFPIVEAFNKIPVDIANFGQHDFDFGVEVAKDLVKESEFQWITSNLVDAKGDSFAGCEKVTIREVNGIKIGFIGITDDMDTTTQDENVVQRDIYEGAREAVDLLEGRVDFIAAITQVGFDEAEIMYEEIPELDAIFIEESAETRTNVRYVGNKPILSPGGNIASLIRVDIAKDKGITLKVYSIDNQVESDKKLKELEEFYRDDLERKLGDKIAVIEGELDAGFTSDHFGRISESNIGNLITDAYRSYYNTDIAFMNSGGIRNDLPAGDMLLKDALSLVPFSNTVGVFAYKGRVIREALEHGVSGVESKAGRFLQVSGVTYTYSPKGEQGSRVSNIKVDGKEIDPEKIYTVALPTYIQNGGDGFEVLKDVSEVIVAEENGRKDIEVLTDYIEKLGVVDYKKEGRIKIK